MVTCINCFCFAKEIDPKIGEIALRVDEHYSLPKRDNEIVSVIREGLDALGAEHEVYQVLAITYAGRKTRSGIIIPTEMSAEAAQMLGRATPGTLYPPTPNQSELPQALKPLSELSATVNRTEYEHDQPSLLQGRIFSNTPLPSWRTRLSVAPEPHWYGITPQHIDLTIRELQGKYRSGLIPKSRKTRTGRF